MNKSVKKELKEAFGKLWDVFDDENTMELIVDGPGDVYYEQKGLFDFEPGLKDDDQILRIIYALAGAAQIEIDEHFLEGTFTIGDDLRVSVSLPPLSVNGPIFNLIRLPKNNKVTWEKLVEWKGCSEEQSQLLQKMMADDTSIIVAGSVGGGKTTLANLLFQSVPEGFRTITIERVPELIVERKRCARLQLPYGTDLKMSDLVRKAAVMRADYLVLNELMREEAYEFINLLRDGHSGMGVMSAANAFDAIKRLESSILASGKMNRLEDIRYSISQAFEYIVFQTRDQDSGRRYIERICRIEFHDGEIRLENC